MKTFEEYDKAVGEFEAYPNAKTNFVYPALALAGEAGEFAEKVKKLWRNFGITGYQIIEKSEVTMRLLPVPGDKPEDVVENGRKINALIEGARKELGDVLWYLNAAAKELGTTLEEVAQANYEKLADREKRGVIYGEGDNR